MITVITVVLNGAAHLEQCLASVFSQTSAQYEHIVIDGGSTDSSLQIILWHSDHLSNWISEPDQGIGDAMNKGITRARGEWLLFLHADDYLLGSEVLARCTEVLRSSSADIVAFPLRFGSPDNFHLLRPRGGGWWLNLKTGLLHQACFIRRRLFEDIGGYDPTFRIVMDYEFFLRARRRGVRIETSNACVPTLMRDSGISSRRDWASLRKRLGEERRVHQLHAPSRAARLGYALYWALYPPYRWLRS